MKKLLSILLVALLIFSLTACTDLAGLSSKKEEPSRGQISGSTYTSSFTNISVTLPSGWTFSSDEEIAKMSGLGAEALGIDNFSQTLANNGTVYDMMATNTTTMENIIVLYENTIKTGSKQVSAEEYLDIVTAQLPESMGYTVSEKGTVNLSGNAYLKAIFSAEYQGVELSQVYYVRNLGDYVVSVIVTSNGLTDPATIETFFN